MTVQYGYSYEPAVILMDKPIVFSLPVRFKFRSFMLYLKTAYYDEIDHLFRSKPTTDSTSNRPLFQPSDMPLRDPGLPC